MHTLKQFDLNMKYGPCVGLSRLERWKRAQKFNKNPPQDVLSILESFIDDQEVQQPLWYKEL